MITEEYARTLKLGDKIYTINSLGTVSEHRVVGISEDAVPPEFSDRRITIRHAAEGSDNYNTSHLSSLYPSRLDALHGRLDDIRGQIRRLICMQDEILKQAAQECLSITRRATSEEIECCRKCNWDWEGHEPRNCKIYSETDSCKFLD